MDRLCVVEPTDAPDANFPSDTPVERYPSMAEDHRLLTVMTGQHTDVVHQLMSGGGGTAFAFDIFLFGLVERSLHLVYGFLATFDAWNLVAAAPLVRLQIDNLVRLCYVRRTQGCTRLRSLRSRPNFAI